MHRFCVHNFLSIAARLALDSYNSLWGISLNNFLSIAARLALNSYDSLLGVCLSVKGNHH